MNPTLSSGEAFGTLIAAVIMLPIVLGCVVRMPKIVMFAFVAILIMFSDSTWGQLQIQNTIYSRGSGMFYFSLINIGLLAAGMAALLQRLANHGGAPLAPPMTKYFLTFLFILFGNIVLGVMLGIEMPAIFSNMGIIHLLNMFVFMYLMILAFEDEKDAHDLMLVIIGLAAVRALYGGMRYVLQGGDPANPYRNFEGMDVSIYFFDIGDNFIAALAAFCAAWLLTTPEARLSLWKRGLLIGFLVLEIAAVALSYRRSSLVGLALMFVFLFLRIPGQRKMLFAVVAGALLFAIATFFFRQRLQFASDVSSDGLISSLIYDIIGQGDIRYGRFYELWLAIQSMEGHWLFGRGTWGTFRGDATVLTFHTDFSFVHSGFGHLILKTGLVGLFAFCAMLVTFTRYYLRHRNSVYGNSRLMADMGFAGFLFWIPTLLIGTPIIEIRTMLLLGLAFSLLFIAVGTTQREQQQVAMRTYYAAA